MKAIIRVNDLLDNKSVELSANVVLEADCATQLTNIVRKKVNRERIIKELKLYVGEAAIQLICDGKVYAEGTVTNNVFSGRGFINCYNVQPYALAL